MAFFPIVQHWFAWAFFLSEWAIRYNDICVLENMHCSEAFFILRKPDCNIFENLSAPARQEIRSTIIHQVLATDIGNMRVDDRDAVLTTFTAFRPGQFFAHHCTLQNGTLFRI